MRYGDKGGGSMESELDGHVELLEGEYWDIGLCTGVSGSGGAGGTVGVDGTDGEGSFGGVGSGFGDSDGVFISFIYLFTLCFILLTNHKLMQKW